MTYSSFLYSQFGQKLIVTILLHAVVVDGAIVAVVTVVITVVIVVAKNVVLPVVVATVVAVVNVVVLLLSVVVVAVVISVVILGVGVIVLPVVVVMVEVVLQLNLFYIIRICELISSNTSVTQIGRFFKVVTILAQIFLTFWTNLKTINIE